MYFFEDYTSWSAVTDIVRLLWRRSCFRYDLFRRPEQPQQPDQYSFEDYFMVGIYIRRATTVPVLNCSPKKLHRGPEQPERPEQYLVTPRRCVGFVGGDLSQTLKTLKQPSLRVD